MSIELESVKEKAVLNDLDFVIERNAVPVHKPEAPLYLVLGSDGILGGYFREDVLLCDLAIHKRDGDPAVKVFKLDAGLSTRYLPIGVEEIR